MFTYLRNKNYKHLNNQKQKQMKKLSLAVAGLLGMTAASDRANYDYTCKAKNLEDCLLNDIYLYGPHVVLVNLDNRCQVEKYESEGIFL